MTTETGFAASMSTSGSDDDDDDRKSKSKGNRTLVSTGEAVGGYEEGAYVDGGDVGIMDGHNVGAIVVGDVVDAVGANVGGHVAPATAYRTDPWKRRGEE